VPLALEVRKLRLVEASVDKKEPSSLNVKILVSPDPVVAEELLVRTDSSLLEKVPNVRGALAVLYAIG